MIACILFSLCLSAGEAPSPAADERPPLVLEYYERPPYSWTASDGSPRGASLDAARAALAMAGVDYRLRPVPSPRQILDVEHSHTPVCAVARYKTPDRELQAKFSRPLIEERPYVVFTRKNFGVPEEVALETLLADRSIRVVVKGQRSYGVFIDAALAGAQAPQIPINGNALNAARMVLSDRADAALLTLDEVDFVKAALSLPDSAFAIARISGVDKGEMNYLMCSRSADDALLRTINAMLPAIASYANFTASSAVASALP